MQLCLCAHLRLSCACARARLCVSVVCRVCEGGVELTHCRHHQMLPLWTSLCRSIYNHRFTLVAAIVGMNCNLGEGSGSRRSYLSCARVTVSSVYDVLVNRDETYAAQWILNFDSRFDPQAQGMGSCRSAARWGGASPSPASTSTCRGTSRATRTFRPIFKKSSRVSRR